MLLINGSSGIAVGYAANIPPHNPIEVIDYCVSVLKGDNVPMREFVKGPDFPTGGSIYCSPEN
jgi:DNA gyrase/topoisomerase IV subunit A